VAMWRHPPTTSRTLLAWRIVLLITPPLLVTAVGLLTVPFPPASVADGGTGRLLIAAWSAVLILGGVLTVVGMCRRRMRPQLAGRGLMAGGAGFYALHLLSLSDGNGLAAAGFVGAYALSTVGELWRQIDLARWQRVDRARGLRHHPAGRGRG
jgi:hypothetical protein